MRHSRSTNPRLDQWLVSHSAYSRRELYELLKQQAIRCNNRVCDTLQIMINPVRDAVTINGEIVEASSELVLLKLNKPKGIISTKKDPKNRPCLDKFLDQLDFPAFPIGRLDKDTKGLLLITNNGDLANKISHPKFELPKTYHVTLDKPLHIDDAQRLAGGFFLEDGPVFFEEVAEIDRPTYHVIITQGRNRIIRRSFEFFGYEVIGLKRIAIGPILLGNLKDGQLRPVARGERLALKQALAL